MLSGCRNNIPKMYEKHKLTKPLLSPSAPQLYTSKYARFHLFAIDIPPLLPPTPSSSSYHPHILLYILLHLLLLYIHLHILTFYSITPPSSSSTSPPLHLSPPYPHPYDSFSTTSFTSLSSLTFSSSTTSLLPDLPHPPPPSHCSWQTSLQLLSQ